MRILRLGEKIAVQRVDLDVSVGRDGVDAMIRVLDVTTGYDLLGFFIPRLERVLVDTDQITERRLALSEMRIGVLGSGIVYFGGVPDPSGVGLDDVTTRSFDEIVVLRREVGFPLFGLTRGGGF